MRCRTSAKGDSDYGVAEDIGITGTVNCWFPGSPAASITIWVIALVFGAPASLSREFAVCAAQKPTTESEPSVRKTSEAARQNPFVRAYFRERFEKILIHDNKEEEAFLLNRTVDNMIDMNTERVLRVLATLHKERDRVQSSMTPPLLSLLQKGSAGREPAQRSHASSDFQVRELQSHLKKIEDLAREIDSQMIFMRYALNVSLEYKLEKGSHKPGEQIRRDIEVVVTTFSELENTIYEFYFPRSSSVTLGGLKENSIPRLLEKIRKHASRAYDTLRNF